MRSLDDPSPGHPPVVVGNDDVTELLCFLGIVRHQHSRNTRGDDHPSDQVSQLTAHLDVEGGERFVEQYQGGSPARPRASATRWR